MGGCNSLHLDSGDDGTDDEVVIVNEDADGVIRVRPARKNRISQDWMNHQRSGTHSIGPEYADEEIAYSFTHGPHSSGSGLGGGGPRVQPDVDFRNSVNEEWRIANEQPSSAQWRSDQSRHQNQPYQTTSNNSSNNNTRWIPHTTNATATIQSSSFSSDATTTPHNNVHSTFHFSSTQAQHSHSSAANTCTSTSRHLPGPFQSNPSTPSHARFQQNMARSTNANNVRNSGGAAPSSVPLMTRSISSMQTQEVVNVTFSPTNHVKSSSRDHSTCTSPVLGEDRTAATNLLAAAMQWAPNHHHQLSRNTAPLFTPTRAAGEEQQIQPQQQPTQPYNGQTPQRPSSRSGSPAGTPSRRIKYTSLRISAANANLLAMVANSDSRRASLAMSSNPPVVAPSSVDLSGVVPGVANASPTPRRRELKIDVDTLAGLTNDSPVATPTRPPSHLTVAAFKKAYAQAYANANASTNPNASASASTTVQDASASVPTSSVQASSSAAPSVTSSSSSSASTSTSASVAVSSSSSSTPVDGPPTGEEKVMRSSRREREKTMQTEKQQPSTNTPNDNDNDTNTNGTSNHNPLLTPPPTSPRHRLQTSDNPTNPTNASALPSNPVTTPLAIPAPAPAPDGTYTSLALAPYMTPTNILNEDQPHFHEAYKSWFREEIAKERAARKALPRNHSPSRSLFSTPRSRSLERPQQEFESLLPTESPVNITANEFDTQPLTPILTSPLGPGSSGTRTPGGGLTLFFLLKEGNTPRDDPPSRSLTPQSPGGRTLHLNSHLIDKLTTLGIGGSDSPRSQRHSPVNILAQWRQNQPHNTNTNATTNGEASLNHPQTQPQGQMQPATPT